MIVEWNAHIFSPDTQRYPLHHRAAYRPDVSVHPPDPLGAYLQRMDDAGIDRAVVVHPEPYGDDHRLILECLEREPERLRGTSLFYPKDPDAPPKLAELVAREPKNHRHPLSRPPRQGAVSRQLQRQRGARPVGKGSGTGLDRRIAHRA